PALGATLPSGRLVRPASLADCAVLIRLAEAAPSRLQREGHRAVDEIERGRITDRSAFVIEESSFVVGLATYTEGDRALRLVVVGPRRRRLGTQLSAVVLSLAFQSGDHVIASSPSTSGSRLLRALGFHRGRLERAAWAERLRANASRWFGAP